TARKWKELVCVKDLIKEERISEEKYKKVQPSSNSLSLSPPSGPQYFSTDGTYDALERKLDEAQADIPAADRVSLRLEDRPKAWKGWIFSIMLPLVLIIVFWIFIMRRMGGGGGGPGGQIFNIGKSKATLFDKESQ